MSSAEGADHVVEIPRKPLTPTLLSITLALEGMVIFFASLTAFGLRYLDMATAFIGGGIIMVLFFATAGRIRKARWALWFGWVLQGVLLATGIILLPMLVIGALFVALWSWCWFKGNSIDRANAAAIAAAEANTAGTSGGTE